MGLNRNNAKGVSPSGQKEFKDDKCRAEKLSSLDEDEETGGREDDLPDVGRVFHDENEMEEDLYNRFIKFTEPIQGL